MIMDKLQLADRSRRACEHLIALSDEVNAIEDPTLRRAMWLELISLGRALNELAEGQRRARILKQAETY